MRNLLRQGTASAVPQAMATKVTKVFEPDHQWVMQNTACKIDTGLRNSAPHPLASAGRS
jgi:hypothetical protein